MAREQVVVLGEPPVAVRLVLDGGPEAEPDWAVVRLAPEAYVAAVAREEVGEYHPVSLRQGASLRVGADALAEGVNHSGHLVSEDDLSLIHI